jgi:hypothetical protein
MQFMELVNRLRPASAIGLPSLPGPDPIGSGGPKRPPQPMGLGDGRFLGLGANWTGQMGTPWTNWKGLGANQHLAALMKMFRG